MELVAMILVMIVLICYMGTIINKIRVDVGEQIRKDVDRLVVIYDDLLEEKSQQLQEIEDEIDRLKNTETENFSAQYDRDFAEDVSGIVIMQSGNYVDDGFFRKYNIVKNEFHDLAFEAMKATVNQLVRERRDINVHEFKEMLATFDYSLQYEMETLSPESQLEIMDLIFGHSMGKRRIVQSFMEEYNEFSFRQFMDYLRSYIFYHDSIITVYSNTGEKCLDNITKNVVFEKDPAIGEGYIVRFRDRSYDFCLKD